MRVSELCINVSFDIQHKIRITVQYLHNDQTYGGLHNNQTDDGQYNDQTYFDIKIYIWEHLEIKVGIKIVQYVCICYITL